MFLIISKWAEIVKQTVVRDDISWYNVPDYEIILKIIISELAERPVSKYPEALVTATTKMLHNQRLLSMFVKIIFKRTNIHNPEAVIQTCETIV